MNYSHTNICVWCVCVYWRHITLTCLGSCTADMHAPIIFPAQTCMLHTKTHFHFITHTPAYRAGQEHTYHIGPSQGTCHTHTYAHKGIVASHKERCMHRCGDVLPLSHFHMEDKEVNMSILQHYFSGWGLRNWGHITGLDWMGVYVREERTLHSDSLLIKCAASCLALFEQCSAFTANDRLLYSCIWWGRYWN